MTTAPLLLFAMFAAPVEAPRPDFRPFSIRLELYRHGPPGGLMGLLGKRMAVATRTTRGGDEAAFLAATPAGWDETATDAAGTRAEIRVVPTPMGYGAVWLSWGMTVWDRSEPGGEVRRADYRVAHFAELGETFNGPAGAGLPTWMQPSGGAWWSARFGRGGRPIRIVGFVRRAQFPVEAPRPPQPSP